MKQKNNSLSLSFRTCIALTILAIATGSLQAVGDHSVRDGFVWSGDFILPESDAGIDYHGYKATKVPINGGSTLYEITFKPQLPQLDVSERPADLGEDEFFYQDRLPRLARILKSHDPNVNEVTFHHGKSSKEPLEACLSDLLFPEASVCELLPTVAAATQQALRTGKNLESVRALTEHGADIDRRGLTGKTPWEMVTDIVRDHSQNSGKRERAKQMQRIFSKFSQDPIKAASACDPESLKAFLTEKKLSEKERDNLMFEATEGCVAYSKAETAATMEVLGRKGAKSDTATFDRKGLQRTPMSKAIEHAHRTGKFHVLEVLEAMQTSQQPFREK